MHFTNILVLLPATDAHKQTLEAAAPQAAWTYSTPGSATAAMVEAADAIIGNPPPALLPHAKNLKWLQLNSAGADAYIKPGALGDDVVLTNATGAYGPTVAEHMFAMLAAMLKRLPAYRDNQRERCWADEGAVRSLCGMTVLVLGLGDIGLCFAELMKPLGSHIIGVRRTAGAPPAGVDEVHTIDRLDELLPRADVVFMILPGTPATVGIMSRERLARMKPGAVLLNAGRGSAVDQEALCDALEAGRLFAAGLDVTDPEPLPADHRMWGVPGLFLTPHASGGFHMPQTLDRIIGIAVENLRRLAAGERVVTPVDRGTGYKVTER